MLAVVSRKSAGGVTNCHMCNCPVLCSAFVTLSPLQLASRPPGRLSCYQGSAHNRSGPGMCRELGNKLGWAVNCIA